MLFTSSFSHLYRHVFTTSELNHEDSASFSLLSTQNTVHDGKKFDPKFLLCLNVTR